MSLNNEEKQTETIMGTESWMRNSDISLFVSIFQLVFMKERQCTWHTLKVYVVPCACVDCFCWQTT